MALSKEAQFLELAKGASHPLILLPPYPSDDALSAGCALALFFEGMGKTVALGGDQLSRRITDQGFPVLPKTILDGVSGGRDFVLSFNTEHNPILDIRTERLGKELRIHLTPEHGTIDPRDFSFILAKYKYDLVITLGARDKESLGKMYEDNPDIFYEVPIINIDTHGGNEQYGQLNLVEVTASSVSEIVTRLLEEGGPEFLVGPVAEALLAGIMAATESFQKKNTTPRALEIASRLMGHGADQQRVVRTLFKTQPLHLLKLLGRLMSNVQYEESERLVWVPVSIEDLVQSRARMEDLLVALERLRASFAGASVFALFFRENQNTLRVYLKMNSQERLETLLTVFSGGKLLGDTLEGTLTASDDATALRLIKDWLKSTER